MRAATVYAGGFLGPFGGGMIVALIPTIAASLDTSSGLVAGAITAYMVPFAVLQLVSGTLAERIGRARVVRAGYVAFGAAGVLCALAPEVWSFMAGRALMGASNAFLTPVLLAALSESVEPRVLGRAVGTFAAVQVAGLTLAPVMGGALGEVSWRLAFGAVAGVAFALAAFGLHLSAEAGARRPRASLRDVTNRWIALLAALGMTGYLGFTAIGFVVTLVAERTLGLGPGTLGLLLAAYGAGGVLLGRLAGATSDRLGRPRTAIAGGSLCAAGVAAMAFVPSAWALGLCYFAVGCAAAFAWAGVNTIAVESFPENRAGAVSAFSAFKFAGTAFAPFVYVPLVEHGPRIPFVAAAAISALFTLLLTPWLRRYRRRETLRHGRAEDVAAR